MPYKRVGKKILVKRGNRWITKQVAETVKNAKATLRLLNAIE